MVITPGTDFERYRAKARAYSRERGDDLALQRWHRNKPLVGGEPAALESMVRNRRPGC